MDKDGKLLTEIFDNKLEVFRKEVVGLINKVNNENDQHIENIKDVVKEIVDNKLEVFREDIGIIRKEKAVNISNERDFEISENEKKRMERRHTYSSSMPVYDNGITRSASENHLTLPSRVRVNMDRSGVSETHENNYDHIDEDEEKKDDDDDKFASTVKSFFESSTLHGFRNLIDTAIWVRVLWFLAMTGVFTALSMQVVGLANDYLSFQVSTDVSISQGDKVFPAITVCNNRRFLISKVSKLGLPPFKSFLEGMLDEDENLHWQHYLNWYHSEFDPAYFADLGAEVKGTIEVRPEGIQIRQVPYHGSCYFVIAPRNTTELTIALNLHVKESIDFKGSNEGLTVYLTDNPFAHHHPLFEPVHEIEAPLGHYSISRISHDVIERLNGTYAQCQENEETFYERTGLGYTQSACMYECSYRAILSKCGCMQYTPGPEYFPFWVKTNKSGCERCWSWKHVTPENCNCKPKCHARIYYEERNMIKDIGDKEQCYMSVLDEICEMLTKLHRAVYGRRRGKPLYKWTKNNTAILTIQLSSTPYKTFKQRPRYPLLRFMADIGGTMGLFIGASVLTTFEFIQMAISGVLHVIRKIKHKYLP